MTHAQAPIKLQALPTKVGISRFKGRSGVEEYHIMICPTEYDCISAQLEAVEHAYKSALSSAGLSAGTCLFRRFFCSDLLGQSSALKSRPFSNPTQPDEDCAVSWVCQPPAPPAKVALWAYHVSPPGGMPDKNLKGQSLLFKRGELTHIWTTGVICTDKEDSCSQTDGILKSYENTLHAQGISLADNVIRTWLFVQNVDADYHGLVAARREIFAARGLTPETHYIASTGIQGASANVSARVMMDAYAIKGVQKSQIRFLSAPEYLSPTHIYGVTFERGVSVDYRDRRHILISGTASIDREGKIVYPGSVLQQLDRTLLNIDALLKQAGAALDDACMFIAYVRDPSDLALVQNVLQNRLGEAPFQVTLAPVCRPGWLVEIECQAVIPASNPALPAF